MAPHLSPFARESTVLSPRQLAPTMGPADGGFEFLKGNFTGIKGYAVGRMTKSRRGKLYIDGAGWGPEAVSIEYGYWVLMSTTQLYSCRLVLGLQAQSFVGQ